MINYSAYPTYKPSGIEWFGEIPEHWEFRRLKFVVAVNPSKSEVSHLPGWIEVSFLPMERVGNGTLDLSVAKPLAAIKQGFTYFRDGDVVVAKITPSFENGKGALASGLQNGIGFGTTELHVIRASKAIDRQYLYYMTLTHQFRGMGETQMFGTAGQKRVPDRFINDFPTPLPPLTEQRVIVAFLDHEITRMDTLITQKSDLIKLLDKKRTSIISHAVTKGLNPKARMKFSGVEWLGEIPEHWEVRRLKFLVNTNMETLPETTSADYQIQYIDIGNVSSDGQILGLQELEFENAPSRARRKVSAGNTIISTVRTYLQAIAYLEAPQPNCIVSTGFAVLQPMEHVYPKYLYYLVRSKGFVDAVMSHSTGVSYPAINPSTLSGLWGCLPPLSEQRKIAENLDQQINHIKSLVKQIEESITLLQKQRIALISAAVTGKIDVRKQGK